jgi:hypothetical protein
MTMEFNWRKSQPHSADKRVADKLDIDALLHPAQAFTHPLDVVHDHDLTLNEKRAILASWASDACAVEGAPGLRINTAGKTVSWDDIMDALKTLDLQAAKTEPIRFDADLFWWPRRGLHRRRGCAADHEPRLN